MDRPEFDLDPRNGDQISRQDLHRQRQTRYAVVRQLYNELCDEHLERLRKDRDEHELPTENYPRTRQELADRLAEITALKEELAGRRGGLGRAQQAAVDQIQADRCRAATDELAKARHDENANKRYDAAIDLERRRPDQIKARRRLRQVRSAKQTANRRQNAKIQKYAAALRQEETEREEQQRRAEGAKVIRGEGQHFPRVLKFDGLGEIPMNVGAVEYQHGLDDMASRERAAKDKRRQQSISRTQRAAFHHKCCRVKKDLQDDLHGIYQYELDDQRKNENLARPASAVPMATTYLVDEKYKARSQRISDFLAGPDAPKPRKAAPQPLPIHQTSPNVSFDDSTST
jgi:hypothetical protein